MRENRTSGSMRRGERRVMVHSANGHRTRKGGNGGAPPDLYTTALALHSTVPFGYFSPLIARRVIRRTHFIIRRIIPVPSHGHALDEFIVIAEIMTEEPQSPNTF